MVVRARSQTTTGPTLPSDTARYGEGAVTPTVSQIASGAIGDGQADLTTYRLSVSLSGGATNIYSIFGTPSSPLTVPAAHQAPDPFGANIGGICARGKG